MAAVDIQFVAPGSRWDGEEIQVPSLFYKKRKVEGTMVVYFEKTGEGIRKHSHKFLDSEEPLEVMKELPHLDSKVVVDGPGLSFATLRYLYEGDRLLLDNAGMPRTFVNSTGYFDKGGGKYSLRLRGRPVFISADKIIKSAVDKKRKQRIAKKRKDAINSFAKAAKKGDWNMVRFFDFALSFPDYSYLAWEGLGEEAKIVREDGGPRASLAEMWQGWRPDQILTPDVGPKWLKERLFNARKMLVGIDHLESLHLLPDKGDDSPGLKLEGDGLKVFRRVEIPSGLIVVGG